MKKVIAFLIFFISLVSCSITNPSFQQEGELFITRKYVGDFIDYSYTQPDKLEDPHLIWIRTTMESSYGKIAVNSKTCCFEPGERLYVSRINSNRGSVWSSWTYRLESDRHNIGYMVSQTQSANKGLVRTWF